MVTFYRLLIVGLVAVAVVSGCVTGDAQVPGLDAVPAASNAPPAVAVEKVDVPVVSSVGGTVKKASPRKKGGRGVMVTAPVKKTPRKSSK